MAYALDLAALPIGAVVIVVDCWGEAPIALKVAERDTHSIVGITASGGRMSVAGPLVRRMATDAEATAFRPSPPKATAQAGPSAPQPSPPKQMELF